MPASPKPLVFNVFKTTKILPFGRIFAVLIFKSVKIRKQSSNIISRAYNLNSALVSAMDSSNLAITRSIFS